MMQTFACFLDVLTLCCKFVALGKSGFVCFCLKLIKVNLMLHDSACAF